MLALVRDNDISLTQHMWFNVSSIMPLKSESGATYNLLKQFHFGYFR